MGMKLLKKEYLRVYSYKLIIAELLKIKIQFS